MRLWLSYFIWMCVLILFTSCQRDQRSLVVGKIQAAAKLSTTQITIDKLVHGTKTKRIAWFIKLNETQFLAYSKAYVKTGIDLNDITIDDISIDGDQITIKLPPIEVINFSYPSEDFILDNEISDTRKFFNRLNVEDQEEFFRLAEIDIRNNLQYMGIVRTSQDKTRQLMTGLLKNLGYTEIYIHFKSDKLIVREILTEQNLGR